GTAFERRTSIPPDALAKLPDGPNQLKIEVLVTYAEVRQPGATEVRKLCEDRVPLTATVQLVPADQPTVERVRDESLRPAVEKAVQIVGFTDDSFRFPRRWEGGGAKFIHMS